MSWQEFIQRFIISMIILAVGGYLLTLVVDPLAWFLIIVIFGIGGLNVLAGRLGQR